MSMAAAMPARAASAPDWHLHSRILAWFAAGWMWIWRPNPFVDYMLAFDAEMRKLMAPVGNSALPVGRADALRGNGQGCRGSFGHSVCMLIIFYQDWKKMLRIATIDGHKRMSTQELLQKISRSLEEGRRISYFRIRAT